MDNTLYHYCSMGTLYKIIEGKNIRLSNALKTNDEKEFIYIIGVIKKVISPTGLKMLYGEFDYDSLYSLCSDINPHIACFSQNSNSLGQWRGYADDGRGICIGFNKLYFEEIKNDKEKSFKIEEVIYNPNKQADTIKNIIYPAFDIDYQTGAFIGDALSQKDNKSKFIRTISNIFRLYGSQFKSKFYKEEEEIRFVHYCKDAKKLEYEQKKNDLISYIEISLVQVDKINPINEVRLGPQNMTNVHDMENFLEKHFPGQGIKVIPSTDSYRHQPI